MEKMKTNKGFEIDVTNVSLSILRNINSTINRSFHLHSHILYDLRTMLNKEEVNYLEIGGWLGSSASLMVSHPQKTNVISVDLWDMNTEHHVKLNDFKKVIDELIKLQKIKIKKIIPTYSLKLLKKEMNLFYEWYLPEFFSKKKINEIKKRIDYNFLNLLKKTTIYNNIFVHRDFHIENLIVHNKKIGFLDTQDAVIGHPAYDLMSLVDDVRIKINQNDQSKLINYYLRQKKNIQKDFIFDFHILSVQRLLKILGIFLRLYRRDHKNKYLRYLPRTWSLLKLRLKHEGLKDLNLIFNKYFSKKIIRRKWK